MSDETVVERPKNLREKLVAAMSDVGSIAKRGVNEKQRYNFQTAAEIFEKTQAAFVKHGIVFLSDEVEVKELERHQTASGSTMFGWLARVRFTLFDTVGDGALAGIGSGIGFDTSDKALNKAKTAALKYFLKQTLLIGEDEDDGDRETITPAELADREYRSRNAEPSGPITDDFLGNPSPMPTPAKKTQHAEPRGHGDDPISAVTQESIIKQCKELGDTVQELCEQYRVTELDQLTHNQYAAIQRVFDSKRRHRGKAKAD